VSSFARALRAFMMTINNKKDKKEMTEASVTRYGLAYKVFLQHFICLLRRGSAISLKSLFAFERSSGTQFQLVSSF